MGLINWSTKKLGLSCAFAMAWIKLRANKSSVIDSNGEESLSLNTQSDLLVAETQERHPIRLQY